MARLDGARTEDTQRPSRASAGRLSLYLRRLEAFHQAGVAHVSSARLGEALGIRDAQVRKDLACVGQIGHPGVGYPTEELIAAIRSVLGLDREWRAVLVGVGNLARALVRYRGFREHGFKLAALFDADPTKIGSRVDGFTVQAFEPIGVAGVVKAERAELGILTVPPEAAQLVANGLVNAGVKGILNFAPTVLRLPPDIGLVNVDLSVQLEQLAFLVQLGGGE